jgi:hypothetical protein
MSIGLRIPRAASSSATAADRRRLKKYGKRLIIPRRVRRVCRLCLRQLRAVPAARLDFPAEVASARFKDATELEFFHDQARYRTESRPYPSPKAIAAAVDLIRKAQRPIVVSSNGVFYAKAWDALKRFAEKAQIPVVESGAMGTVLGRSPHHASGALASADLGFSSASTAYRRSASSRLGRMQSLRIDQATEDIGRNLPFDPASSVRAGAEALADAVPRMAHAWIPEIAAGKFEDRAITTRPAWGIRCRPSCGDRRSHDFLYCGTPAEQTTVASGGAASRLRRRELQASAGPGHERRHQYGIGPDWLRGRRPRCSSAPPAGGTRAIRSSAPATPASVTPPRDRHHGSHARRGHVYNNNAWARDGRDAQPGADPPVPGELRHKLARGAASDEM